MSRAWPWLAGALAGAALIALLVGGGLEVASSALSQGERGWLGARRYLEARGAEVTLRDTPLGAIPADAVLVLAFPWQELLQRGEVDAIFAHLRAGGAVVVATSRKMEGTAETRVLEGFGVLADVARSDPPLSPRGWWRYQRERWRLRAVGGDAELMLPAAKRVASVPARARPLFRDVADGAVRVYELPVAGGRVVVLPADLLANAWLGRAGNADLLETLLQRLGPRWIFDEYHHGAVPPDAASAPSSRFAWDLLTAHLVAVYALLALAVGRRFGPAWREPPVTSGSSAEFLRHMGALHSRLGHEREASVLLVDRARALSNEPHRFDGLDPAANPPDLVDLARRVAHRQGPRPLKESP